MALSEQGRDHCFGFSDPEKPWLMNTAVLHCGVLSASWTNVLYDSLASLI